MGGWVGSVQLTPRCYGRFREFQANYLALKELNTIFILMV